MITIRLRVQIRTGLFESKNDSEKGLVGQGNKRGVWICFLRCSSGEGKRRWEGP